MATADALCNECEDNPDPTRENESSGYCPETCFDCGACTYCDGSC